jgi:hypothetical protein
MYIKFNLIIDFIINFVGITKNTETKIHDTD